METMINLNDLLKHEILDLYSAEEQILEALPAMIEKAKNPELKAALRQHLKITEDQKSRLDKVKETFGESSEEGEGKGFFSRLFGGRSGGEKCRGMEGLITEGEKIMAADITDEALDAAIIASAQKIEHYEICGYGTARAFARELKLQEVERLLTQTLNEEYEADEKLTALAVGKLNMEAEMAVGYDSGNGRSRAVNSNGNGRAASSGNGTSAKGKNSGNGSKPPAKKGSNGKSSAGSKSASRSSSGGKTAVSSKNGNSTSRSGSKSSKVSTAKGSGKSSGKGGSTGGGAKADSKGNSKGGTQFRSGNKAAGSKSAAKKGGSKIPSKSGSRKR